MTILRKAGRCFPSLPNACWDQWPSTGKTCCREIWYFRFVFDTYTHTWEDGEEKFNELWEQGDLRNEENNMRGKGTENCTTTTLLYLKYELNFNISPRLLLKMTILMLETNEYTLCMWSLRSIYVKVWSCFWGWVDAEADAFCRTHTCKPQKHFIRASEWVRLTDSHSENAQSAKVVTALRGVNQKCSSLLRYLSFVLNLWGNLHVKNKSSSSRAANRNLTTFYHFREKCNSSTLCWIVWTAVIFLCCIGRILNDCIVLCGTNSPKILCNINEELKEKKADPRGEYMWNLSWFQVHLQFFCSLFCFRASVDTEADTFCRTVRLTSKPQKHFIREFVWWFLT